MNCAHSPGESTMISHVLQLINADIPTGCLCPWHHNGAESAACDAVRILRESK